MLPLNVDFAFDFNVQPEHSVKQPPKLNMPIFNFEIH